MAALLGLRVTLCSLAWAASAPSATGWSGPATRVVQGTGLPSFSLTFSNGTVQHTPALWLVGGSPSLYDPIKEPRFNESELHFHDEVAAASSAGVRIVAGILSFVGYAGSPELLPDGSVTPRAITFLRRLLAQAPDSLLLLRIRLDLKPPAISGHRPGSVVMQSILNASHTGVDELASPTSAWAARLGNRTARAVATIDAAFPGRVIGVQILHGNYPGAWSAASVEGRPAGSYDHMWPDYSTDGATDYCRSAARPVGPCVLPTAAERNTPNLGSTLIIAPNSVAFNRFINIQMASGIAAVGEAIKAVSSGKVFITTLYGGSVFNGAAYAASGGSSAMTELLGMRGIDGNCKLQ